MEFSKILEDKEVKIYRNSDVEAIIAGIPRGHYHIRMMLVFKNQAIVLHEATIAAIVRAYIDIITHPLRRAVVMYRRRLTEKKHGYAQDQLIEVDKINQDEVVDFLTRLLKL